MTREHVFARWLVERVRGARLVPTVAAGHAGSSDPRIARVIATVCAECNAGWMSSLEVSFRRTLFARPRVGPLPAAGRVILSRWFTKTAVLLAHAQGRELVGAAHRPQLITGMPDDLEVFIARRRRPRQQLDYRLEPESAGDGATAVHSVAILVEDLVAHVAATGTLTGDQGTRLWPLRSHLLRWDTLPVTAGLT